MSTPEDTEAVVTTSERAIPRLPSIEDKRNRAARALILEYLSEDSWDLTREQRGVVLALRFLVRMAYLQTPEGTYGLLEHVADCLGIDLPARTGVGEAPR